MAPLQAANVPDEFIRAIESCMARRDPCRMAAAWSDVRNALASAALVAVGDATRAGKPIEQAIDELITTPRAGEVNGPETLRSNLLPTGESAESLNHDAVDVDKETQLPRPPRASGALALDAKAGAPNIYASAGIVYVPESSTPAELFEPLAKPAELPVEPLAKPAELPVEPLAKPAELPVEPLVEPLAKPAVLPAELPVEPLASPAYARQQWARLRRVLVASPLVAAAIALLVVRSWERPIVASPTPPIVAVLPVEVVREVQAPPIAPTATHAPPSKAHVQLKPTSPAIVPNGCGDIYYCEEPEVLQ